MPDVSARAQQILAGRAFPASVDRAGALSAFQELLADAINAEARIRAETEKLETTRAALESYGAQLSEITAAARMVLDGLTGTMSTIEERISAMQNDDGREPVAPPAFDPAGLIAEVRSMIAEAFATIQIPAPPAPIVNVPEPPARQWTLDIRRDELGQLKTITAKPQ